MNFKKYVKFVHSVCIGDIRGAFLFAYATYVEMLNTKNILYGALTFLLVKLTNMQIIKDVRALKKHLVTKVKSNDNDDK